MPLINHLNAWYRRREENLSATRDLDESLVAFNRSLYENLGYYAQQLSRSLGVPESFLREDSTLPTESLPSECKHLNNIVLADPTRRQGIFTCPDCGFEDRINVSPMDWDSFCDRCMVSARRRGE